MEYLTYWVIHSSMWHLFANAGVGILTTLWLLQKEEKWKDILSVFFLGIYVVVPFFFPLGAIPYGASAGVLALLAYTFTRENMPNAFFTVWVLVLAMYFAGFSPVSGVLAHLGGLFVGITYGFMYKGFRE